MGLKCAELLGDLGGMRRAINGGMAFTDGSKYASTRNLRTADIAKLVRGDIKAAIKAGELPAIKTSVRTRTFSGGSAIDVYVTEAPYQIETDESVRAEKERPHEFYDGDRRTPEAIRVVRALEGILAAYNSTDIDSQVDLFLVRFYAHAEHDWKTLKADKAATWERLSAADAVPELVAAPEPAPANDSQADFLAWAGA